MACSISLSSFLFLSYSKEFVPSYTHPYKNVYFFVVEVFDLLRILQESRAREVCQPDARTATVFDLLSILASEKSEFASIQGAWASTYPASLLKKIVEQLQYLILMLLGIAKQTFNLIGTANRAMHR